MISTSQKEHLTYTAIWQVLIIIWAIVVIFSYVSPGFTSISTNLEKANSSIDLYKNTEKDGLSFIQLNTELKNATGKEELISIIKAASQDEVSKVIRKEGNDKYITWLKQAINSSDEDRRKLVQIKQKINSILPTLSPMSANIDEENITLKQYIRFIEARILKEFNFDSNVVLGLQWINYWAGWKSWSIPKTIGSFDLSLDFKSSNSNIQKFITYINNSGNGDILTESGSLQNEEAPWIMSNPLITIESISLTDFLDPKKPTAENSGRVTLRFYVRGSSQDDLTYLKENVKNRKENLKKKITEIVDQCKNNTSLCGNLDVLKEFQSKYEKFMTSTASITSERAEGTIEKLSQQVVSLRAFEKELEDIAPTASVTNTDNTKSATTDTEMTK